MFEPCVNACTFLSYLHIFMSPCIYSSAHDAAFQLKVHWTHLVILFFKDQYSHLLYPNICIKSQTCVNLGLYGHRIDKRPMKEMTPLLRYTLCAFRCIKASADVFYYVSENLPLSQKLGYFRFGVYGAISHICILSTGLSACTR